MRLYKLMFKRQIDISGESKLGDCGFGKILIFLGGARSREKIAYGWGSREDGFSAAVLGN